MLFLAASASFSSSLNKESITEQQPILVPNASSADPYVTTFPISHNSSDFSPFVLYPASDRTVWLVAIKPGNVINSTFQLPPQAEIVNFTTTVGAKPVITLVNAIPSDIVYDQARKRVWFLENDSLAYYNRTAFPGNMTVEQTFPNGSPQFMTIDLKGRVWLTLLGTNQIAEYDPTTREPPRFYDAPSPNAYLQGLAIAPDGSVWFSEPVLKRIGHIVPCQSASCSITDYGPPNGIEIAIPIQLTVDPAGTVWFTDHGSNQFGSFNPSSHEWKVFPIGYCSTPFALCATGLPNAISVDSSGRIWFSEHYAGRVAQYNPSSETLTEYTVPATSPPLIWWASPGPGNLVWFVALGQGEIGYVNASIPIPFSISAANSIEVEQGGSKVIPVQVQKQAGESVFLNASANSYDAPPGHSPLLYGSPTQGQLGPSNAATSNVFRISAAWNLGLGVRYLALTVYTDSVAVNTFVRVDVIQAATPYFSTGLASTIAIVSLALYWRYTPRKSKISQTAEGPLV